MEVSIAVGFGEELIYKTFVLFLFLASVLIFYYLLKLIFWWYPELKNIMMPSIDSSDQDFRLSIGVFFIMIGVMKIIHLELAFGAFIAGSIHLQHSFTIRKAGWEELGYSKASGFGIS